MRNFARIENGVVCEVFDLDAHFPERAGIEGLFHPSIEWRPAPVGCAEGWVVLNGEIVPPDHYEVLRAAEYPDFRVYLDGMAKKNSTDPVIQAAGDQQLSDYYNACLAVKLKYPKPEEVAHG